MDKLELGVRYDIHCYKHDSSIHKYYDEAVLLEENEDFLVFGNERTKVIESDGRSWRTQEPAVLYFFKHNWFNVIGQIKENGIYYYCNLASPYVLDGNTIKYIDYDLDLRVYPDGAFRVLDRGEYNYHKAKMHYSKEIDIILKNELTNLIEKARVKEFPFSNDKAMKYHELYKKYKQLT